MGEILGNLATGFVNAVQPLNFLMIVVGLAIGIIAGALPGITMLNSIVLVLPFTYLMGIVPALLLMIGVFRFRLSVPPGRGQLLHRPDRALRHRRGTRPERGALQRAGRRAAPCPRSAALVRAGALAAARAAGARHSGRDRRRRPRRRRGDGVVVRFLRPREADLADAGAVRHRPRRWTRRLGELGQRLDG